MPSLIISTFLSGAAALIFEILWTRSFCLIFGSTVEATSAIFAAFIGGLAIGVYFFSKILDKTKNPLTLYLIIEIATAISALLIGILIFWGRINFVDIVSNHQENFYFLKTIFTVLVTVFIPTFLMGGTLPVLIKIASKDSSTSTLDHSYISRIYAFNVAGASLGSLLCPLVLIPQLGIMNSLIAAALLNIIAGVLPILNSKLNKSNSLPFTTSPAIITKNIPSEKILLMLVCFSGFTILSLEIVWIRLSNFFLGNRTFALSILLFSILWMLFLGAKLSAILLKRFGDNTFLLLEKLLILALVATTSTTFLVFQHLHFQNLLNFESKLPGYATFFLLYKILITMLYTAPSFIILGCIFPLCLSVAQNAKDKPEKNTAKLYFWNTIGSVVGAIFTGFFAFHFLTSFEIIKFLLIIVTIIAFFLIYKNQIQILRKTIFIFFGLIASLLIIPQNLILLRPGEKLLWQSEDQYSVYQVTQYQNGYISAASNHTKLVFYLGAPITSQVQEMQAQLGLLYASKARNALIIGSGYGITAGTMANFPQIKEVDAVEILPAMLATANLFSPFNYDYYKNPKVKKIQDDGRHYLTKSKKMYDIISSNITDPHLPGGADLFHKEFMEILRDHLTSNGVLVLHIFGHDFNIILNTISSVFPHILLYQTYSENAYNIVASMSPLSCPPNNFTKPKSLSELPSFLHSQKIASDNFPLLEFSTSGNSRLFLMSNE